MRYHITAKGNPGQCRAKAGNCPLSSDDHHFDSKEEAAAAFEAANKESTHNPGLSSKVVKEPVAFKNLANANVKAAAAQVLADGGRWVGDDSGTMHLEDSEGRVKLSVNSDDSNGPTSIRLTERNFATPEIAKLSTTMLFHAAQEEGYAARSYLRLLNHQNYDQVKGLYGKVKDSEVIEAVKESHRAASALIDLETQLNKAQGRQNSAPTFNQRAGYTRAADAVAVKLTQAAKEFDTAEIEINRLKAKYAKQLGVHNNSLKALEKLADSDKKFERPKGIERRINELRTAKQGIKPIALVATKLGSGNPDQTSDAAQAYGNPYYTEAAENLRVALVKRDVLESDMSRLEGTATHPNKAVRETALSEIDKGQFALVGLHSTIKANEPRVALFKDEIRDRAKHEDSINRELSALTKIEAKTR